MSNPIQIKDALGVAIFKIKSFIFPDGEVGTAPVIHGPDGTPLFTATNPAHVAVDIGTVTIGTEIEIKNDAGNPIPTRERAGVTPTQSYVPVPAYSSTDATTVKAVATTTIATALLTIDNNGSNDVELWFGSPPSSAVVGQTPRQGKVLPAGAGLFFDTRIPLGPIYATGLGATGLSILAGA